MNEKQAHPESAVELRTAVKSLEEGHPSLTNEEYEQRRRQLAENESLEAHIEFLKHKIADLEQDHSRCQGNLEAVIAQMSAAINEQRRRAEVAEMANRILAKRRRNWKLIAIGTIVGVLLAPLLTCD